MLRQLLSSLRCDSRSHILFSLLFSVKRSVDVAPFLEITYVKFAGICFRLSHIPLFSVCESLPFPFHKSPSLVVADYTSGFSWVELGEQSFLPLSVNGYILSAGLTRASALEESSFLAPIESSFLWIYNCRPSLIGCPHCFRVCSVSIWLLVTDEYFCYLATPVSCSLIFVRWDWFVRCRSFSNSDSSLTIRSTCKLNKLLLVQCTVLYTSLFVPLPHRELSW